MNTLLKHLMLGGSATALVAGASFTAAFAQNDSALEIEEIQSSVSRIDLKGFEAPTPVTVIGIEALNRDAKIQIGEALRELPQIRGGSSISAGSGTNNLSQVNAGADTVNIRGLGSTRNLVLFDRQRVVTSNIQDGTVDLSLIPSGLTQRVDVVTGGASAAWGSDAVTGVINIVINKTFEGFKGSVTYADSAIVDNPTYRASLAWGTSFLGGKGHIVAAADFTNSKKGVWDGQVWQAIGNNGRQFVYNPAYCNTSNIVLRGSGTSTCSSPNAGQPMLVYAYGTGDNTSVVGGLITGNSVGAAGSPLASNALRGTMFVGEGATPTKFNYGTTYNTSVCYNGCTNDQYSGGGWGSTSKQAYHSATYFSYASYQILPDVKASIQLNYARMTVRSNGGNIPGTNRTMYADNPYLPDSIAQSFVCNTGNAAQNGLPSTVACGTTLSNGYNPYTRQNQTNNPTGGATPLTLAQIQARPSQTLVMGFSFQGNRPTPNATDTSSLDAIEYNYEAFCDAIMQNCAKYHKTFSRAAFALDGSIGDSWTWNAYFGHSISRIKENIINPLTGRFNNSLDAVRVTSGNVGSTGLPIGSIQCRGLINPGAASAVPALGITFGFSAQGELAGCVPFNPFGDGKITNAARNYITPTRNPDANNGEYNGLVAQMVQTAAAFSMSGVLPWQLPAGEIGVAYGGEWRIDRHGQYKIDLRSQAGGMYPSGNFGSNFEGKQHAEEGFLELQIPILKDTIVQNLSLSAAGRLTNYSNSGLVETWKLGLQSQIIDDVRFRLTWSHDIRSPTVFDLSAPGTPTFQGSIPSFIIGPGGSNGGNTNGGFVTKTGNASLSPERANTITAGFIFTPTFLDGLTASFDWYQIHLSGGITTPGFQDVISRCRAGELVYCPLITFGPNALPYPQGTTLEITGVREVPVNAGSFTTAGFDFAIAYGFDLFTGTMDLSANANYNYDFSRTLNGVYYQGAGATGGYYNNGDSGAKFQGTVNMNYREGAWSFGLQNRITGESVMNFGNPDGLAVIPATTVTYTTSGGQILPNVANSDRRNPGIASTNYNAAVVRTDIRVQYRWSNNITLFGNIDNMLNVPGPGGFTQRRNYRMGVRFNY